jgi:hypothetical protein
MLSSLTVTERLFSILLQAFISVLNAVIEKSVKHEIIGDVSTHFIAILEDFVSKRFDI